jgi:hypothetical protein
MLSPLLIISLLYYLHKLLLLYFMILGASYRDTRSSEPLYSLKIKFLFFLLVRYPTTDYYKVFTTTAMHSPTIKE